MSFLTRHTSILIGTAPVISGTMTAVDEEPTITDAGWDSLQVIYALRRATLTAEELAALFPIGAQLGDRKFWLQGVQPQRKAPGFWLATADFKGWGDTKPAKITVGATADQQSAENIYAPTGVGTATALFAKVETHENAPTINASYLVENADESGVEMTSKVGTAVTPPVTIAVPATVWTFLTRFVWHWPQGWVLMGSAQDRLPGTSAALVTDSYKYIRAKTPG